MRGKAFGDNYKFQTEFCSYLLNTIATHACLSFILLATYFFVSLYKDRKFRSQHQMTSLL